MPTKVYTTSENKVRFSDASPGASEVLFQPQGLVSGSGHNSDPRDFSDDARFRMYKWRAHTVLENVPPSASGSVEIYMCTFDEVDVGAPVYPDGDLPSGDGVIAGVEAGSGGGSSVDVRRALHWVGAIDITSMESGANLNTSGMFWLPARFGSVVWWNMTDVDLSSASGDHSFEMWPIGDEIQN